MRRRDLILAAAGGVVFAWLAWTVIQGRPIGFDAPVRATVSSFDAPVIVAAMRLFTLLGWDVLAIPLMAIAAWRLAAAGRRRDAWLLAVTVIGIDALVNLLKFAFERHRPDALFGYALPSTWSFPSGHAALSLALFGSLAALLGGKAIWTGAVTLIALVGLSRIYLGVHYPSDVAAGYALSVVWVIAVRWMFSRHRGRH